MRSETKKDVEHLDVEFCEILVAIVRSRDGAGVKECVEWLKHGQISSLNRYPYTGREAGLTSIANIALSADTRDQS
jgi:hypothetical protein